MARDLQHSYARTVVSCMMRTYSPNREWIEAHAHWHSGKAELCVHREPTERVIIVIVAEKGEREDKREESREREREKGRRKCEALQPTTSVRTRMMVNCARERPSQGKLLVGALGITDVQIVHYTWVWERKKNRTIRITVAQQRVQVKRMIEVLFEEEWKKYQHGNVLTCTKSSD